MTPLPPVIQLVDVGKTYHTAAGETPALLHVNFAVHHGDFVSIIGPSGSGKSTLMNIIGLLDRPTGGSYLLNGYDSADYGQAELAHLRATQIGFVFQSFNLLPRASVLQNVMLPLAYTRVSRRERKRLAADALERVGLPAKLYSHESNEISGGQMQRVAIARALVNNPSLILADEPTGNLDSKTGEAVLSMFRELNRDGATIVLITHDMGIARHAHRVATIRDGLLTEGDNSALDSVAESGEGDVADPVAVPETDGVFDPPDSASDATAPIVEAGGDGV
ncbi:MAG: ABC transporter ATP-binding protein [Actinomycetes bacterium]|jgi:putative ABC transport system ATP-binding protein|nr:ABC transporter ATP-binding protein [Actinomycetes bacterium]